MRRYFCLAWFAFAAVLAGCVPTLHPLYTEDDVTFDPALVGLWGEDNSKDTWLYEKADDKSYRLIYTDGEGKKGEFQARLVKLGGLRFLDLYPEDAGLKETRRNDFYVFHFFPVHTFLRVDQVTPTLQLAAMQPEWVDNLLNKEPSALAHEKAGDRVVITASTKHLQAFVLRHAANTNAWNKPSTMKRR